MQYRLAIPIGLCLIFAGGLAALAAAWPQLGADLTLSARAAMRQVDAVVNVRNLGDVLALAIGLLIGAALAWHTAHDTPTPADPDSAGEAR